MTLVASGYRMEGWLIWIVPGVAHGCTTRMLMIFYGQQTRLASETRHQRIAGTWVKGRTNARIQWKFWVCLTVLVHAPRSVGMVEPTTPRAKNASNAIQVSEPRPIAKNVLGSAFTATKIQTLALALAKKGGAARYVIRTCALSHRRAPSKFGQTISSRLSHIQSF